MNLPITWQIMHAGMTSGWFSSMSGARSECSIRDRERGYSIFGHTNSDPGYGWSGLSGKYYSGDYFVRGN